MSDLDGLNADAVAAVDRVTPVDHDDFEQFFAAGHDDQVRRAFLLVGSAATAHDVVAEAYLSVYRRWGQLDDAEHYLNRCVTNGCRDVYRRRGRWAKLISARPLDHDGAGVDAATVDGSIDQWTEARVELAEALAILPYRQRAAIVLRFYGRESEAAIADALGCRPGTVGSLIHRGLGRLRKELS
jgi:RNA polymerase sigma factor (sigma-70 family)